MATPDQTAVAPQLDDSQTIPVQVGEFDYAPGDGVLYSIRSIQGRSTLRRLGLERMSDAWKEYVLTYYDSKRPARKPRHSPPSQRLLDESRMRSGRGYNQSQSLGGL